MNVPSTSLPDPDPGQVPANELPVIEVKNLVKEYRLGAMEGLRSMARRLLGRSANAPRQQFRALDDVSFSVKRGEVVGIIGHNGAGKSTLLKHLCRITAPTSGSVTVRGRVAPLIEVGAGLVGEMTGRENIYLNASILGLTREEIESKVDEIITFAELERFIDTPIKRYSSGMQVRLGYAIATAADADVLIVDEVLAVGDLQFQRKSIERMQRMIRDSQRTVLIVGHNIRQLERLCSRMILLDHGKILVDGNPASVTNRFFDLAAKQSIGQVQAVASGGRIESSGEITIERLRLVSGASGKESLEFHVGEPISVEMIVWSKRDFATTDIGFAVHTPDLMNVGISPLTGSLARPFPIKKGRNTIRCLFGSLNILPGLFFLKVGLKDDVGQMILTGENLCPFHVLAPPGVNQARYSAITFVEFPAQWSVTASGQEGNYEGGAAC